MHCYNSRLGVALYIHYWYKGSHPKTTVEFSQGLGDQHIRRIFILWSVHELQPAYGGQTGREQEQLLKCKLGWSALFHTQYIQSLKCEWDHTSLTKPFFDLKKKHSSFSALAHFLLHAVMIVEGFTPLPYLVRHLSKTVYVQKLGTIIQPLSLPSAGRSIATIQVALSAGNGTQVNNS